MSKVTEKHVKEAVKKVLKDVPRLWYFMPVSLGMGVHGIPDFIGCFYGMFFCIETKRPGRRGEANGGLSALQVKVKKPIEAAGGAYFVVDGEEGIEDVQCWIRSIGGALSDARAAEESAGGTAPGGPEV